MKNLEWFYSFDQALRALAHPQTRQWWNRYLKNEIEFIGVSMGGIRETLKKKFQTLLYA